jgi:hypothetical protein
MFNSIKYEMEQLIYDFVYDLSSSSSQDSRVLYHIQVLSEDNRFTTVLEEVHKIYENKHKVFERGYNMLEVLNSISYSRVKVILLDMLLR